MKKVRMFLIVFVLSLTLVGCDLFGGNKTLPTTVPTTTAAQVDTTSSPTVTTAPNTTSAITTTTSTTSVVTTTLGSFVIEFNSLGGSAVNDILQIEGTDIIEPEEPEKEGYSFSGWFRDQELSQPYTFSKMPSENLVLYAGWTPNNYTISFNSNGGTAVENITAGYETTISEPEDPSLTGYDFAGWFSDAELTNAFTFNKMPLDGITLYAKWAPALVDVTVNYYTETLTSDVYELNSSDVFSAYTESVYEAAAKDITGFTEFASHANTVKSGTVLADGSLELNIYYSRDTYTLSFDTNSDSSISSVDYLYGATILEPSDPTNLGYDFDGWYADSDLSGLFIFGVMPANDITIYAKWIGLPSSISFVTFDAPAIEPLTGLTGDEITLPTPVLMGYSFAGWFENSGLTEEFTESELPYGDMVVYAKFTAIQYTLSFNTLGGNTIADQLYEYNKTISYPANPEKTGFIFDGWFYDEACQNPFLLQNMPNQNVLIYAKWVEDFPNSIYNQINQTDGSGVSITGLVYAMLGSDYSGYFVYDETGKVFIMDSQVGLSLGDEVTIDGTLDFVNGVPQIITVTNVTVNSSNNTLDLPTTVDIGTVNNLPINVENAYKVFITSGILHKENNQFILTDPVSLESLVIYDKSYLSDSEALLDAGVLNRLDLVFALVLVDGHFEASLISTNFTPINESEAVSIIQALIDNNLNNQEVIPGQEFTIPGSDPFGFASVTYQTIGDNAAYYDMTSHKFLETTETRTITFEITLTINSTDYTFTFDVILNPVLITSIADFLNGIEGNTYLIEGTVVSISEMGDIILKDDTGFLYAFNKFGLQIGDKVMLTVRKDLVGEKVYLDGYDGDMVLAEFISSENELGLTPVQMTVEEFLALEYTDPTVYGRYVEIRAFLIPEEMGYHSAYYLIDGEFSAEVFPFTYSGFEKLMDYGYLEVVLRGYIDVSGSKGGILIAYEGIRQDIQIPEYTDSELVQVIADLFHYEFDGRNFEVFDSFLLYPYHPVLGATVEWVLDSATEAVYDMDNQSFKPIFDNDVNLSFTITIEKGTESISFVYQSILHKATLTEIADLIDPDAYGDYFVQGLVAYWHPDYLYLMDSLGNLIYVDAYIPEVKAGDEIIVYGSWNKNYQGAEVYLTPAYSLDNMLIEIISRDNPVNIPVQVMDLGDILNQDVYSVTSYDKYVEITGRLEKISSSSISIVTPDGIIRIDFVDIYTLQELMLLEGENVTLRGFVSSYQYDYNFYVYLWHIRYVGMEGDVVLNEYTDLEKIALIEQYILDNYQTSVFGGETFDFGTIAELFPEVSVSMTDITDVDDLLSFSGGYNVTLGETLSDSVVVIQVDIDSAGTTYQFNFNFTVKAPIPVFITDIENINFNGLNDYTVEGMVISTIRVLDSYYYLMVYDGTGYVFVRVNYEIFDDMNDNSNGLIGDELRISGTAFINNGRPELQYESWSVVSRNTPVSATFTPMTPSELNALDMLDQTIYGMAVSVSGVVERVDGANGAQYYINAGGDRVLVSDMDVWYGILNQYIGYEVTIRGFVFGANDLFDDQGLSIMLYDYDYSSIESVILGDYSDQEITDLALAYILNMIDEYNPIRQPGEWVSFPALPGVLVINYPSLSVAYSFLEGGDYVSQGSNYYEALVAPQDVDLKIQVTVTLNSASSVSSYVTRLNGFTVGVLDDLFAMDPGTMEIGLEATILYSGWGYYYLYIDGEIYYLDAFTSAWVNPGDEVYVLGKKNIIDGIPNYTYDIMLIQTAYGAPLNLTASLVSIADLYSNDYDTIPLQRDYLGIYGKLGFDPYLQMFTLEYGGQTVYIRTELNSWEGPTALFDFVGDYVIVDCMMPMEYVRNDIILLDTIGTLNEITLPTETPENHVAIAKEKLLDMYASFDVLAGDNLGFLPENDFYHDVSISYQLVNSSDSVYVDIDNFLINYVDTSVSVDILVTFLYVDNTTSDTATITLNINPRSLASINDVLFAGTSNTYLIEGIIHELHVNDDGDYLSMILADASGRIYVDLDSNDFMTFDAASLSLAVGDEVRIIATRSALDYEGIVSMLMTPAVIQVLSTGNTFMYLPDQMTFEDILALDYLDPDVFYGYVSVTGTVTWNYNSSNPEYYLTDDTYYDSISATYYDLTIIGPDTASFETELDSAVGFDYEVTGYLIGYYDIENAFSWMIYYTDGNLVSPS